MEHSKLTLTVTDTDSILLSNTQTSSLSTDKTGKISLANLKQVSRLCGVKLNEQELKEMIQEADKDGDSEVDQEEFVNIMLKTNLFSS